MKTLSTPRKRTTSLKEKIIDAFFYASLFLFVVLASIPLFQGRYIVAIQAFFAFWLTLIALRIFRTIHPLFAPAFVFVVVFNANGWIFDLYERFPFYDEVAHFITPAVMTAVIGALLVKLQIRRTAKTVPYFFFILISIGTSIAAIWEIGEYIFFSFVDTGYVMTLEDTISDLFLDLAGSTIAAYVIVKWNRKSLIQEGKQIQEIPYIAKFDSATTMVRALTSLLHKEDFAGLGVVPSFLTPLLSLISFIPRHISSELFMIMGKTDALATDYISDVNIHRIAHVICQNYPKKKYPAIVIGSANGALVHLCAALQIPFLPQTLPLLLRKKRLDPDNAKKDLEWARKHAEELLTLNPDLHVSQMIDPVHDRLMSQVMCYFRVKIINLPESYKRFIEENLEPGGTIIISNCTKSWLTHTIHSQYSYQLGGAGDLTPEEYFHGSDRLATFLKEQKSKYRKFKVPEPNDRRPEAEWGYDMRLTEDLEPFAKKKGYQLKTIEYQEPQDMSEFVADLYRSWYHKMGYDTDRLFVESFMYIEPYYALRARLIPYWMYFNTYESSQPLEAYLSKLKDPYREIYMALFSNGIKAPDFVTVEQWEKITQHATEKGMFLGVDKKHYPNDFASNVHYFTDLKAAVQAEEKAPPVMKYSFFEDFMKANQSKYPLQWS